MTRSRGEEYAARIGIVVEFAALIRCLGEYFRLGYMAGARFDPISAQPFIVGALVAAVFCLCSVLLYFAGRWRLSLSLAIVMVATLLIMKFTMLR